MAETLADKNPPFFIVGCGRSGTTLLKSILSAHPELFVMPETFFFKSVFPNVRRYGSEPWLALSRWWLADAGITPNNLRSLVEARLAAGISKECAVFGAIFDFHAALHPGAIVGEKTPGHVNHVAHIRKCFPNAKIIMIIRDPRAVVSSFRNVKVGSNSIADITAEWAQSEQVLESNANTDEFLALRYEDLLNNPGIKLNEVCAFLGIDWTADVLNFHKRDNAGYAPEQVHHANTRKPLFLASIDTWRDKLSNREVGLIEWALKDGMQRRGYVPDGTRVAFPNLQIACSRLIGLTHKLFIRFPRQKLKAFNARRRISRERSNK